MKAGLILLLAAAAAASAAEPRVLRVSQRNEPDDLDPATASLPDDFFVIRALGEGLVAPSGDGLRPAAAERWEASADGIRWTFHLRPDGRWSDGAPVTAADFVASFRRALAPATAAPHPELFFPVRGARAFFEGRADFAAVGFAAPDPLTLVVELERPIPRFLAYAASDAWVPADPKTVARFGRDWTRPGHHVGNGPFTLAEWRPHQRIVVRRNRLFHDAARVGLDEIQFLRFDDESTEELSYRAGQVDVTMTVPRARIPAYEKERPDELRRAPLAETRYLAFNVRRKPLDDPRVRRALSLAVDREPLARAVLRTGVRPTERLLPPELGLDPPFAPAAAVDRASSESEARRLLAEAGFPGGRGFPALELSGWSSPLVLEAVQGMWKEALGVEVSIVVREARAHEAALRSGAFDVGFITLIPTVADPLAALERFRGGAALNYPHWSDPGYDALLDRAARAGGAGEQDELLRRAEDRLLEAQPLAPLYFNAHVWLTRPSVRGWSENALWTRDYLGLSLAPASQPR